MGVSQNLGCVWCVLDLWVKHEIILYSFLCYIFVESSIRIMLKCISRYHVEVNLSGVYDSDQLKEVINVNSMGCTQY
jgi:hypothetical protein